jgi:glycosyltransferase involved in cell wall biosynthesis
VPRVQPLIRICHLITDLDAGGAERALVNLVTRLDSSRFSSEVVTLIEPGVFADQLRSVGIPVTSLGMTRGRPSLSATVKLVRHLRRTRPAILQTWLYHADLLGTIAHRFAPRMHLVWNVRCSNVANSAGSRHLRVIVGALARLSRWPKAIIANSHRGKTFHERLKYRPRRWIEIPNGVDTNQFRPRPDMRGALRRALEITDGEIVVGMIAGYRPMKDHRTFLQAAAQFAKDYPNTRYLLCGEGCGRDNASLRGEIESAGLPTKVVQLGLRKDMDAVYAAIDISTLPSAFGEGFPNAVIESMACGVPCVSTDVGDCREIIGDSGVVVPPRDPLALARGWRTALDNMEIFSKRARARAVENFPLDAICLRYEEIYQELAWAMQPGFKHTAGSAPQAADAPASCSQYGFEAGE